MDYLKEKINRRDFFRHMGLGSLSLYYACTSNPTSNESSIIDDTSPETVIALHKTSDRTEGVKKVMELLEYPPMDDKHVIVKPNFNTADPAPASTHNDTLQQIFTEIKSHNPANITLAERSYQNFDDVIRLKSIDSMANDLGFNIVNLNEDDYTVFNSENLHWRNGFRLPITIGNAEYLVTTCCLKTHFIGVITMSLKLGVGILPTYHMSELHGSADINKMIAEINLAYKPDLIIMDGVSTFIDGGPSSGTEKAGNVVLAGTDRVAIDAVGTAILKDLGSTRVSGPIKGHDQISRACDLRLGVFDLNKISFVTADQTSKDYADKLTGILEQG